MLLLEAGGNDDSPAVRIPAAFGTMMNTSVDWSYTTVPQVAIGKSINVPRGRMLGGSSSMNGMMYVRGNEADFDGWRDNFGAEGWGYADVLPYFIRAEDNSRLAGPFHGTGGPQRIEDPVYLHEVSRAFVDTAVSQGLARNDDFNGKSQFGAGFHQVTCKDGERWSAADGYLRPAMSRPNLTVLTDSQAVRVQLTGARATGVVYRRGGTEHTVQAEAEVLLCGGVIGSPQLLMLSGIGPAAQLRELGIEPVVDLSGVGANLQEHPTVPMVWRTTGTTDVVELAGMPEAMAEWQRSRRGPLTSNIGEAAAFLSLDPTDAAPSLQLYAGGTAFFDDGQGRAGVPCFGGVVSLVTPRSRGTVRLASADPDDKPLIDFGFYQDRADFDTVLGGLHLLHDMVNHDPLRSLLAAPYLPTCADPDDAELTEHIKRWTQSMYHPAGTCAMGTGDDAVLDPSLRVRGISGLRVVDASVMPTVTRGNTHAPTNMIAEKAADLIKS